MFSGILKIKNTETHTQRPSKKARKSSAPGIEGSFLRLFSWFSKRPANLQMLPESFSSVVECLFLKINPKEKAGRG